MSVNGDLLTKLFDIHTEYYTATKRNGVDHFILPLTEFENDYFSINLGIFKL